MTDQQYNHGFSCRFLRMTQLLVTLLSVCSLYQTNGFVPSSLNRYSSSQSSFGLERQICNLESPKRYQRRSTKAFLYGDAYDEDEDDDDDDDDDDSENRVRRSRRLEKKEEEDEAKPMDMGADFDEANIIVGKRKRKRVNYRKLNDMMFGDLSDQQQGMIDGGDDFDAPKPAKAESDNESGGEESGEDGSENGSDDGSGSGSEDGSDKESNEGSDDGSEDETGDGSDDESDSN